MTDKPTLNDSVWQKLRDSVAKLDKSHVKIGWLEKGGKGTEIHEDSEYTNAEIAAVHEFGTKDGKIPARKPLRHTLHEKREEVKHEISHLAKEVCVEGKAPDKALAILGEKAVDLIRDGIREGLDPPLKYRDGTPLYNTGQLLRSISYEVVHGHEGETHEDHDE